MKPAKNRWPAGERSRNVLFIAQLFREMLKPTSFESFRVKTLDIKSQVRELITQIGDVVDGRVPISSIDPCVEELADTLDRDQTCKNFFAHEAQILGEKWSKSKRAETNLDQFRKFLISLHKKLSIQYKETIQNSIINSYKNPHRKDELRENVNSYCSMLVNDGYSKEYILEEVENRFFEADIKKIESRTLQRFFSKFDDNVSEYCTYIPISKNLAVYAARLELRQISIKKLSDLSTEIRNAFLAEKRHDPTHSYFYVKIKIKDRYGALRVATEIISSVVAMTYLGRQGLDLDWCRFGYVAKTRSKKGGVIEEGVFLNPPETGNLKPKVIGEMKVRTKQILSDFSDRSTERILSAVNISALSRSSPRPENQLITLWAAIEVLLSDPPKGVPRVVHYVDTLTPCICQKYVRKYTIAVFEDLRVHYFKHIDKFLKRPEFDQAMDIYSRFSQLVYREDLKPLHADFCAPMIDNPLALYRLWKLEKNFGTVENLTRSINDHEKRVRWQLFRIYRTRNSIVHSGKVPTFLVPLVMNLFEYFRGAVGPVFGRASLEKDNAQIDQVVAEIGFDYSLMKLDLKNRDPGPLTEDEINRFQKSRYN